MNDSAFAAETLGAADGVIDGAALLEFLARFDWPEGVSVAGVWIQGSTASILLENEGIQRTVAADVASQATLGCRLRAACIEMEEEMLEWSFSATASGPFDA